MIEKEKLEEAKRLYKTANADQRYVLERLFPELKELWDEIIRKKLVDILYKVYANTNYITCAELEEAIAWLEKQGDKPNNIKSLFKAGDCITNGEYTWFISDVCFNMYILLPLDGNVKVEDTISYVDKHFRLWSINDAKDGDILWHSDSASNGIFIFKEIRHTDGKVLCYCDYDSEDHFCTGEYHTCCWSSDSIKPATKEQRDHLFEKMKEAGYEWDAEKKELRKIEQMPNGARKIRKNK